ncbi:hypothetical protein [Arthrobacter sp. CG_A4]|uniref:hypothetical protein n=1 Tax=Arthrobacter sp. CG_A4 TaxID=3071706 RepID=UPI002E0B3870|nr:DNA-binding FrmR family transcriptional regulator [Arthrobacter sp. CG_A4]
MQRDSSGLIAVANRLRRAQGQLAGVSKALDRAGSAIIARLDNGRWTTNGKGM